MSDHMVVDMPADAPINISTDAPEDTPDISVETASDFPIDLKSRPEGHENPTQTSDDQISPMEDTFAVLETSNAQMAQLLEEKEADLYSLAGSDDAYHQRKLAFAAVKEVLGRTERGRRILARADHNMSTALAQNLAYQDKIQDLKAEILQLNIFLKKSQGSREFNAEKLKEVKGRSQDLQKEIATLKGEIAGFDDIRQGWDEEKAQILATAEDLRTERKIADNIAQERLKRIDELVQGQGKAFQREQELMADMDKIQNLADVQSGEIDDLEEQLDRTSEKVQELSQENELLDAELDSVKTKVKTLKEKNKALTKELKESQKQSVDLSDQKGVLVTELGEAKEKTERLALKNETLTNDFMRYRSQQDQMFERLLARENEIPWLKRRIDDLEEAIQAADEKAIKLESDAKGAEALHQHELEGQANKISSLESDLQAATAKAEKLEADSQAEAARHQQQLDEQANKIYSLESALQAKQSKIKSLTAQVRNLEGTIQVAVRIRPSNASASLTPGFKHTEDNKLEFSHSDPRLKKKEYIFDNIFDPSTPFVNIFATIRPLLDIALDSRSPVIIMFFGRTGTGKSFTADQTTEAAAEYLFSKASSPEVKLSFSEIYNKEAYDLLSNKKKKLAVPTGSSPIYLPTLSGTTTTVTTLQSLSTLVSKAKKQRQTSQTNCNDTSSRSHVILSLLLPHGGSVTLVDLAGHEQSKKSGVEGVRAKEATNINQSLSELTSAMETLSSQPRGKSAKGAGVRKQDVLTRCFLGMVNNGTQGNGDGVEDCSPKVLLVATVDMAAVSETKHTLDYAEKAMEMKLK